MAQDETTRSIVDGLNKLALVLRKGSWEGAGARRLTPTQGQILRVLLDAPGPARLGDVSRSLAITPATASKAVSALIAKGLVEKLTAPEDARALALTLTAEGRREARRVSGWASAIASAVAALSVEERAVLLRTLVKIVRRLQLRGEIDVARTCAGCIYFRPFAHPENPRAPHHCAFVDAPFGDGSLRVDCPDHVAAPADVAAEIRRRFLDVVP